MLQNNDIALSVIHGALDERTFEKIKNIEMAYEAWRKLEESFEGTQAVIISFRQSVSQSYSSIMGYYQPIAFISY
jgi:hypothetical protein